MKLRGSLTSDALLYDALLALQDAHDARAHAIRTTGGGGGGDADSGCQTIAMHLNVEGGPDVVLGMQNILQIATRPGGGTDVWDKSTATNLQLNEGFATVKAAILRVTRDRWFEWLGGNGAATLTRVSQVYGVQRVGDAASGTTTVLLAFTDDWQGSRSSYNTLMENLRAACGASAAGRKPMTEDKQPNPSIDSPLVVLTIPPGRVDRAAVSRGVLELATSDGCSIQVPVLTLADSDVCIVAEATGQVEAACKEPPEGE